VGSSKSRTRVTQVTEQKSLTTSIDNTIQPNAITQVGKLQTENHINSDLAPEKNGFASSRQDESGPKTSDIKLL
jgi:hypothetical protein